MTYTDDEVREALKPASKTHLSVQERREIQRWAAEQFLKAKLVIEIYADDLNADQTGYRAREFLNQIKS